MRIWSLHPMYLDSRGLVAAWRESLLAQKVLLGLTKGYVNHPQLMRFRCHDETLGAIGSYLQNIYNESLNRGYNFNINKVVTGRTNIQIIVTKGQLIYEFNHLLGKLKARDRERFIKFSTVKEIISNSIFDVIPGEIESWEKINSEN